MSQLKYAYYPGCSGEGSSKEYDSSTRAMCAELGIELVDIPDWNCCGSTPAHAVDHLLSASLAARNLTIAQDMDVGGVVTPCPSCLKNLKTARLRMARPAFRAEVERIMGRAAGIDLPVVSVLEALTIRLASAPLAEKVRNPLKGLKVVPYYGCLMNRPPDVMAFDDPENPVALDNILANLGAQVLPFSLKVDCCGASLGVTKRQVVTRLSGRILAAAVEAGADAVVTACPMCQMNLDMRQGQVNHDTRSDFHIPVFYYSQLVGLATGQSEASMGMNKLCVSPDKVLRAMAEVRS
ncbi:MAG: CoB--CoM heterodisulfide reductase iron-sulfur subunit B family protein [Desulfovibrionaceae bacterium]